jgi:lipoprotein signal peptidase
VRVRTPQRLGALAALVVFALDRASKLVVLEKFGGEEVLSKPLTPFLDLTLHWNRGISFSFFRQDTPLGVLLLLGFTLAATALLAVWLWRTTSWIAGLGLGAIIGGALGNACDRMAYGAVVDFLDLHALGRHFFVFNVADAAINVGVALLILDGLFGRGAGKTSQSLTR